MYSDSVLGLCLDVSGPEGNSFVLLGHAARLSRELGFDKDAITAEMKAGDYRHLVETFERHFGDVVTLVNKEEVGL